MIKLLHNNYTPSPKEFFGTLGDDDLSYDEIKKMRKIRNVAL